MFLIFIIGPLIACCVLFLTSEPVGPTRGGRSRPQGHEPRPHATRAGGNGTRLCYLAAGNHFFTSRAACQPHFLTYLCQENGHFRRKAGPPAYKPGTSYVLATYQPCTSPGQAKALIITNAYESGVGLRKTAWVTGLPTLNTGWRMANRASAAGSGDSESIARADAEEMAFAAQEEAAVADGGRGVLPNPASARAGID